MAIASSTRLDVDFGLDYGVALKSDGTVWSWDEMVAGSQIDKPMQYKYQDSVISPQFLLDLEIVWRWIMLVMFGHGVIMILDNLVSGLQVEETNPKG